MIGEDAQALCDARAAHAAAPDAPGPLFRLCILLLRQGDPAAAPLLALLERHRGFGEGWEELGRALRPRQPGAARVAFARAAQAYAAQEAARPGAAVAQRLGVALREAGDLPAARVALERATAADAGLAGAWFTLGLLCQDLHDAPAAMRAFAAALAARPDFHEAAFNLGVATQEAGALDPALDAYARAWRLRPDSFGRIAQALVSPAIGRLWLDPAALERDLAARA